MYENKQQNSVNSVTDNMSFYVRGFSTVWESECVLLYKENDKNGTDAVWIYSVSRRKTEDL